MMQQQMAIVPLQHQIASMTQHNEGEIQEQEAQNQEDIADVPQLQLQIHVCVSSKCNQVIHQIKMLLSVQFPKEQFLHQWKNIGYDPYFRDKNRKPDMSVSYIKNGHDQCVITKLFWPL
ncbi:uncharacterized protein LOC125846736 isoform X2 [Solanum stenotomum]|uniref:uncharacterized protein LOC125846736 isoform X1 n=1 Tax=Solanum stenotomum TaxID=172797 RepID=UPI0020D11AE8|nr:uncharacterized protein LOC125846736 isoform X1 [Solanum stenotomum]XP_049382286.1 uncharacterized protein LOC125846736 isoform X2 [Solanum stenotomum]